MPTSQSSPLLPRLLTSSTTPQTKGLSFASDPPPSIDSPLWTAGAPGSVERTPVGEAVGSSPTGSSRSNGVEQVQLTRRPRRSQGFARCADPTRRGDVQGGVDRK